MEKKQLKLNKLRSESPMAIITSDNSTVKWNDKKIPDDEGCVRTTLPVPRNLEYFIFEAQIIAGMGLSGFIG